MLTTGIARLQVTDTVLTHDHLYKLRRRAIQDVIILGLIAAVLVSGSERQLSQTRTSLLGRAILSTAVYNYFKVVNVGYFKVVSIGVSSFGHAISQECLSTLSRFCSQLWAWQPAGCSRVPRSDYVTLSFADAAPPLDGRWILTSQSPAHLRFRLLGWLRYRAGDDNIHSCRDRRPRDGCASRCGYDSDTSDLLFWHNVDRDSPRGESAAEKRDAVIRTASRLSPIATVSPIATEALRPAIIGILATPSWIHQAKLRSNWKRTRGIAAKVFFAPLL